MSNETFNSNLGMNVGSLVTQSEIESLSEFIRSMGIAILAYEEKSHMNLTWEGLLNGNRVFVQFGPDTNGLMVNFHSDSLLNHYFSHNKYIAAAEISAIVGKNHVSTPVVLGAGFNEAIGRSWIISNAVRGVGLDSIWENLKQVEKNKICFEIGKLIARIHTADENSQPVNNPVEWCKNKIAYIIKNLQITGVYTNEELADISVTLKKGLKYFVPNKLTPTHNDILQKNILMRGENIACLIDWETAEIGSPISDILLAAWWISGEKDTQDELFRTTISGYNSVVPDLLKVTNNRAEMALPFVDLLWYLNILWVKKAMGDFSNIERRKRKVKEIVESIENKMLKFDRIGE